MSSFKLPMRLLMDGKIMEIPKIQCTINIICELNPSEDSNKVKKAITNILGDVNIITNDRELKAITSNLESLQKIHDSIHSHQSKNAYRRQLNQNLNFDSSWFYLNKQAAFANSVALCSETEESPLGPIKIILNSKKIDQVIDWLLMNSNKS